MILVSPEELANDASLFDGIKTHSPVTDQCGVKSRTDTTLAEIVVDDTTDTDADEPDSDGLEETQFDDMLLDDYLEDKDENESSDDEDQADEVRAMTACTTADKMDIDEAAITPRPDHEVCRMVFPLRAGCVWTRPDWSCAYDVVFMAFFSIYRQSSLTWRDDWRKQSPEWTTQLADRFDLLLEALDLPGYSRDALSKVFSRLRDHFRDQISSFNPQRFPRRGQVLTSVCAILELLFGSVRGPGIEQHVSCTSCGLASRTSRHFPYLGLPVLAEDYRRETDPRFAPSETLLARFVESMATKSPPCGACHGPTQIQSITMPNSPWIWFETNGDTTMAPSPTMLIKLSNRHIVYDLHAIIYLGGDHFTARMQDSPHSWWSYDGMWEFGVPRHDRIQITTDLLYNGRRHAAFFIYRRSDR